MRRLALPFVLLLTLLALLGCDPWKKITPDSPSVDERLGTQVVEVSRTTGFYISAFYGADRVWVSVFLSGGHDRETLEAITEDRMVVIGVDPDTGETTTLPAPPVTPQQNNSLGRVLDGAGVVLAMGDPYEEVAFHDGTRWVERPAPERASSANGHLVATSADALYYQSRFGDRAQRFASGAWEPFGPEGVTKALTTAITADRVAFVAQRSDELCVVRYAVPAGTLASEVCWDTPAAVSDVHATLNGTPDRFFVLVEHTGIGAGQAQVLEVDGESFREGPIVSLPLSMYPAPSADRIVYVPSFELVHDGELLPHLFLDPSSTNEPALGPFEVRTQCACARNDDPSCDCVARDPLVFQSRISPDTTRAALVWTDQIDGYRRAHVRVLDLPYEDNPYGVDMALAIDGGPRLCDLTCDPFETCVFDTNGTPHCWPRDAIPDGGVIPPPFQPDAGGPDAGPDPVGAWLLPMVTLTDGTAAELVVEGLGDPVPDHRIETDGRVAVVPFATYRLTFSGARHGSIEVEATAGAFGTVVTVGPHELPRGVPLGVPGDVSVSGRGWGFNGTIVHPDGRLLVTSTAERWLVVREGEPPSIDPVDGHVPRVRTTDEWASSHLTPDGRVALLDTEDGLIGVRLETMEVLGVLPGGPFDLGQVAFAGASSTFAVRERVTDVVTGEGPTVVATWSESELTEVRRIAADGLREHLRADGLELVRNESGTATVYALPTGDPTTHGTLGPWGHAQLSPSGRFVLLATRQSSLPGGRRPSCWNDVEGCRVRYFDREMPSVVTPSTSARRFWMSVSAEAFARAEQDSVVVHDMLTGSEVSVPLTGVSRDDGGGSGDTFTASGTGGIVVVNAATGASIRSVRPTELPARRTLVRRSDGSFLIAQAGACVAECALQLLDPATGTLETLPGELGLGVVGPAPGVELVSPEAPIAYRPIGGEVEVLAGLGQIEATHAFPTGHGAPCFVFALDETWDPGARGLYCGP